MDRLAVEAELLRRRDMMGGGRRTIMPGSGLQPHRQMNAGAGLGPQRFRGAGRDDLHFRGGHGALVPRGGPVRMQHPADMGLDRQRGPQMAFDPRGGHGHGIRALQDPRAYGMDCQPRHGGGLFGFLFNRHRQQQQRHGYQGGQQLVLGHGFHGHHGGQEIPVASGYKLMKKLKTGGMSEAVYLIKSKNTGAVYVQKTVRTSEGAREKRLMQSFELSAASSRA